MLIPSIDYRKTALPKPQKLYSGLDAVVNNIIGLRARRKSIALSLRLEAEAIDALSAQFAALNDHHLQEQLLHCRDQFRRGKQEANACLMTAMAAIREAADRKLGLRPFVVQLMGALAMYRGNLAEMATGEGKTLTAGITAILWAWTRYPCHIITVNDYLVQRDAEWLSPLYHFCGIRVGYVTGPMSPQERLKAYGCDITYTSSKEVTADFLRDCLHLGDLRDPTRRLIRHLLSPRKAQEDGIVMRGLHSAIIDEADSVLIDEAVTPLIISTMRKNQALKEVVSLAKDLSDPLTKDEDYTVNLRYRDIEFTTNGKDKLKDLSAPLPGIWKAPSRRTELVKHALVAREFYHLGKQYLIKDNKIVIVDEFTGRSMPQRTWREGMHQAIEAKEGLEITDPTDIVARISFQRFFRLYQRMAGMTGTASEAANEFWHIYHLPVISIPPNRPCIRQQYPDRLFATQAEKWDAVVNEIQTVHSTGRPILVGTRSIITSEYLAERLAAHGLRFQLLNAVKHQEEAMIVAVAGESGRITIATNMAGRGTDIKLGQNVPGLGGLHVIATERHESQRVDRQLFGRSARQGDPGSAQAFMSLEDDIFARYLPPLLIRWLSKAFSKNHPLNTFKTKTGIHFAQSTAEKLAFKMRKGVLKTDDWMEDSLGFGYSELGG